MEKKFKRTTVTSALPYANGPVHIGHLAGVYVPADIYVRYLRLKKEDVLFIGGSDEHGVPITIRAKKEGITPQDVVDRYHSLIKESFKEFGISFDVYSRTTSPTHHQLASDFFKTLYNKGEFIEKTSEQYYDEEAKTFLADRYITGECPHCHSEGAYGDQCEKCGTSLSPTDLINPKSAISGSKPVMKETKHWYLPLDKHEAWLRKWILEDHKEWRPNVYGQCKSWLDMGLQPRAVSRDLDWGIPVPVEGAEGKVLYVWFDAPIGYISNTKELLPDSWETWWKDPETRLIHFIGKDNIVFHCIVFPAMLKAEGSYILPDNVPSNEFLNLEGDKISTSRNWAVWLHEYLADFPGKQDVLRYVLTANAPETKDNDFTWKDFQARNNNELVAVYGNFVNRAMVLTQKYFDGRVPAQGSLTDYDKETLKEFADVKAEVEKLLDVFKFRDAQKEAMNLARIGNKYLADTEPWKLAKTDMERVGSWHKLIRSMLVSVTLYLVVCLFFIALFFSYAYPLVMGRIPGMKGSLLSFVLVLLIISPFLCAIIMKKNNSVEFRKLWADNRFNRGLLVSMIVIKVLICIIIVMGIIIRLFNVALGSGLILSFLIIVVIYFSKRIRKRSLSMEKQFLENFQGTAGTFPQEEPETGETSTEKNHELSNK